MSQNKFQFKFSPAQIAIIRNGMKEYGSSSRGMARELKEIRDRLEDLEFEGGDCQLIQGALDSNFSYHDPQSEEEIEGLRVRLMFYQQWHNQDGNIPNAWRSPKDMIKQDWGGMNALRKKRKQEPLNFE